MRADANERAQVTAAILRLMRQARAARRPRTRLPRQVAPRLIEQEYARELLLIVARVRGALGPLLEALPDLLRSAAAERRIDAGESQRIRDMIAAALKVTDEEFERVARNLNRLAERVAEHNRRQLSRQIRAALGADVFIGNPGLVPIVEGFAAENAALIRDVPAKIIGEVERAATRAVTQGTLHRDLAKEIEKRIGFGRDRARLIARDQVGKLYGQINAQRQRSLGVTHFIWRTSNDERVRDEHEALEGERFSFARGAPGEGLPGEPILCRCFAEPDFSEILGAA